MRPPYPNWAEASYTLGKESSEGKEFSLQLYLGVFGSACPSDFRFLPRTQLVICIFGTGR